MEKIKLGKKLEGSGVHCCRWSGDLLEGKGREGACDYRREKCSR